MLIKFKIINQLPHIIITDGERIITSNIVTSLDSFSCLYNYYKDIISKTSLDGNINISEDDISHMTKFAKKIGIYSK